MISLGKLLVNVHTGQVFKLNERFPSRSGRGSNSIWIELPVHHDGQSGYPAVQIWWEGKCKYHAYLHILVYIRATGELKPDGYDIDHLDRNVKNPVIGNLELKPSSVNRHNTTSYRKKEELVEEFGEF